MIASVTLFLILSRFQTCLDNSVSCLYKHETELSKHVWNLKKENRQFSIRWAIVKQLPAGRNGKRNCTLCLEEKLLIMKGRSKNILNRRSEMFSKCRHVIEHHCFRCHLCLYAFVINLNCQLPEDRQPA